MCMENKCKINEEAEITLLPADFEEMFTETLSSKVKAYIAEYKLSYRNISPEKRDEYIRKVINVLLDNNIVKAGEHRIEQWENGWSENLDKMTGALDPNLLIPHYFGKYNVARLNQKWVQPASEKYEYHMLGVILDWLFDTYIQDVPSVYEFGCGTGYHLFRARKFNKDANLWGLDWTKTSQEIIRKFAQSGVDSKLFAHRFDYYNPDVDFKLDSEGVVYTVASLEQIGNGYDKFVAYLLENKPKYCIHIEPIAELLDENNLLDFLSIQYFNKRNYLNGFLSYLQSLEEQGQIKIHKAKRTYIGSFFIDGYSVIVWSPL